MAMAARSGLNYSDDVEMVETVMLASLIDYEEEQQRRQQQQQPQQPQQFQYDEFPEEDWNQTDDLDAPAVITISSDDDDTVFSVDGEEFHLQTNLPCCSLDATVAQNSRKSDEKSKEELEISASTLSRIEQAETKLKETRDLYIHLHDKMENLKSEYLRAKREYEELEKLREQCAQVLDDRSAILEHQNILYERALLQDKYGGSDNNINNNNNNIINNINNINNNIAPIRNEEENIEELFKYRENLGIKTRLRFFFPDGTKKVYETGSKQTLDVVAKFASKEFAKELLITGRTADRSMTLEEAGIHGNTAIYLRYASQ